MVEFSHFEEFCGCKDLGKHVEIHDYKLKWKRGENDFFSILRAKITLNLKSQRVEFKVRVVKGVKKG